jgi:hypothetical protein
VEGDQSVYKVRLAQRIWKNFAPTLQHDVSACSYVCICMYMYSYVSYVKLT